MEKLTYLEGKKLTYDSFEEYVNDEGYSVEQAIAATFEDNVLMMREDRTVYLATIQSLALIAINEKILPDYILERLDEMSLTDSVMLSIEDKKIAIEDKNEIFDKIRRKNFEVVNDEIYKMRTKMLLE